MTDDEISEFAEAVDDACQEARKRGEQITDAAHGKMNVGCMCPLGALLRANGISATFLRYPTKPPDELQLEHLQHFWTWFACGFDGGPQRTMLREQQEGWRLGRMFREKYVLKNFD